MGLLKPGQVKTVMRALPGWRLAGRAIVRRIRHKDFVAAMRTVNKLAKLAEEKQHHPDFQIHWNVLTLKLWSHDMGGITERDVRMARAINKAFPP